MSLTWPLLNKRCSLLKCNNVFVVGMTIHLRLKGLTGDAGEDASERVNGEPDSDYLANLRNSLKRAGLADKLMTQSCDR
jgi:hypothetical protein